MYATIFDEQIGNKLAALRVKNNMSQQVIADCLDLPRSTICRIERGQRPLRVRELLKLTDLFGDQTTSIITAVQYYFR